MPSFEIRYGEFERKATAHVSFHHFDVRCGDTEARLAVGVTDKVWWEWDIDRQEVEHRLALRHLKGHLASLSALSPHEVRYVLLTVGEPPDVGPEWTARQLPEKSPYEWKECRFQQRHETDMTCRVAHRGDPMGGATTTAICEKCGLPSTDLLCDKLVHLETVGVGTDAPNVVKRTLSTRAACDVGNPHFSGAAECIPGGVSCWVQTYEPQRPAVGAEPGERDLAAEALDMVDTLNIIFRDQFDLELFRLKQFRTGRVLMGPCPTEEGFVLKLQVLADLIDLLNSKQLGEAQGATSQPGSVNWLAAFLGKVAQGEPAPVIQTLRDIRTVRKQVAAHSAAANDFINASARLGIDLPIRDWQDAWRQVLSAFLDALRRLQGLIP